MGRSSRIRLSRQKQSPLCHRTVSKTAFSYATLTQRLSFQQHMVHRVTGPRLQTKFSVLFYCLFQTNTPRGVPFWFHSLPYIYALQFQLPYISQYVRSNLLFIYLSSQKRLHMKEDILEDLGLSKAEIKVYISLLELGSSSAGAILQRCGLQNSVTHRALNSLIEKGLISYIAEGKRKIYRSTSPDFFYD